MLFSHTRSRLAFKLFGFSTDILTAFCNIETGKSGVGWDVRNNLKSRCTCPGSACSSSSVFSSVLRKLTERWQFCSTAQEPRSANYCISASAAFSIPRPSDNTCILRPIRIESAKLIRSDIGSAISFSKKRIGFKLDESLNDFSKLKIWGWINSAPSTAWTYSLDAAVMRSGRNAWITKKRWNAVSCSSNGAGNFSYSGVVASNTFFHWVAVSLFSNCFTSPLNCPGNSFSKATICCHDFSESHSACGLAVRLSPVDPTNRNRTSGTVSFPSASWILTVISSANSNLCASNNDLHTV